MSEIFFGPEKQFKVERVNCTAIFGSEHTSALKPTLFPSAQYFFREINGIGSTFYFRQFVLNRKSKSFTGWLTEWEDKIGNRLQLLTQFCVEVKHSSYFFQWRVRDFAAYETERFSSLVSILNLLQTYVMYVHVNKTILKNATIWCRIRRMYIQHSTHILLKAKKMWAQEF